MNQKTILPLLAVLIMSQLIACQAPGTPVPTLTPTSLPTTPIIPPSATPLPTPTETPTPLPPTPTATPENPIAHFPVSQEFYITSIHMLDNSNGWSIGGLVDPGEHVLRTVDGAITWADRTPPEGTVLEGNHKTATGYFQDPQTAWVIFSNTNGQTPPQSVVWRTQDGGLTWQASQPLDLTDLNEFYNPSNLQFVDGQTGWLMVHVGVGMSHDYFVLYRSTDGGLTWERLLDPFNDSSGIMTCSKTGLQFTDPNHGWMTGDCHGVAAGVWLFSTRDGGATWERVSLPDPISSPGLFSDMLMACGSYNPSFFGTALGHLAINCTNYASDPPTYQYYIFTTRDAGSSWTSSTYPGEALYFFSPETGWALASQIHRTSDGGLTWKHISNVSWQAQVDFVSEQVGWAVARSLDNIALVRTIDGGAKWGMLVPIVGP